MTSPFELHAVDANESLIQSPETCLNRQTGTAFASRQEQVIVWLPDGITTAAALRALRETLGTPLP